MGPGSAQSNKCRICLQNLGVQDANAHFGGTAKTTPDAKFLGKMLLALKGPHSLSHVGNIQGPVTFVVCSLIVA